MKRALFLFPFLLAGCVKTGFPSLMCQHRGSWSSVDNFAVDDTKDAAGYRPTSDKLGNTFIVGYGTDSSNTEHWVVRKSADRGATWTTVEDFQLNSNKGAIGLGILSQPSGNLFAVGYAYDALANLNWVVRKSTDAGATWTTSEAFQLSAGQTATGDSITQDSAGVLYASGAAADGTGMFHWIVRKSADSGTTWTTVDDFNAVSDKDAFAEGGVSDSSGALYIVGNAMNSTFNSRWTVRKTVDGGTTWTTSDDYSKESDKNAAASGIAVDHGTSIVAVGNATTSASVQMWTIRRSTDNGATWSTVDEFTLADGQESQANSVVRDPFGNFYVVGSAVDSNALRHLVLRKSSDGGATWSTLHDFQLSADANTSGYRLNSDPDGNLYVVGRGQTAPGSSYRWFTHLLKCE